MGILESNKTDLSNISAGADVSARDIIKTTNHNYNTPTIFHEDLVLKRLLEEHESEKKLDPEYKEFSEELNKFFSKALKVNPRDLTEKLSSGDREFLIDSAMDSKERLTKKIKKYSLYKSAQEIYTYLLTNIRSAFQHEVRSKIKSGEFSLHQIDDIVSFKIIDPFLYNLQGSSLNIDKDELYGVLYFLTGNCYIEWD